MLKFFSICGLKWFNFPTRFFDKLKKAADGDLKSLVERIKAISDVSKNYKSYSGLADDADGKVDFIFKTDGIEKDK